MNRIIAIPSDRIMAAVKDARHGVLQPLLQPNHVAIASINSLMQCMMKEVAHSVCLNQDQPMDRVDFQNLVTRLKQHRSGKP